MEKLKWEEKNLIEQERNCSNNIGFDPNDITINIEPESKKKTCGDTTKRKYVKWTTQSLIEKFIEVHGERYDYSKVKYSSTRAKIEVICKIHGSYFPTTYNHLIGQNCKKCSDKTMTTDEFIKKCVQVHGEKYNYDLVLYKNSSEKVEIICPEHGSFFQTPKGHLYQRKGCKTCAGNTLKNLDDVIKQFVAKHGNLYDYSEVEYKNAHEKVKIICKKHGSFYQSPNKHLFGNGCVKCSHCVSIMENEFLNNINVPIKNYSVRGWRNKRCDGYDPKTNTIYEFLGDYWHGNPEKYPHEKIHPVRKKTFGQLYKKTFENFDALLDLGYRVKYVWESDWEDYKRSPDNKIKIREHFRLTETK